MKGNEETATRAMPRSLTETMSSALAPMGGLCLSRRKVRIQRQLRGRQDFLSHGLILLHRTRMEEARDREIDALCQSKTRLPQLRAQEEDERERNK